MNDNGLAAKAVYGPMTALDTWANDPRVLKQLATKDPSQVVDGDYIMPMHLWNETPSQREQRFRNNVHLPDGGIENGVPYGKLSNHITVSNESPFSEGKGGKWIEHADKTYTFKAGENNRKNYTEKQLRDYFNANEKGNKLIYK
jgi:hypothetical protein